MERAPLLDRSDEEPSPSRPVPTADRSKKRRFGSLALRALQHRFLKRLKKRDRPITVEGLDYIPVENSFYFERQREAQTSRHLYGFTGKTLAKFIITILAGGVTGLLASSIASANLRIIQHRNSLLQSIFDTRGPLPALLFFTLFALSLVFAAAAAVVFVAPEAGGAGVSLVMAFLNGAHIPDLLRPLTLLVKALGLICGVSSNLAIGPEGPMVALGAAVASCMADNNTYLLPARITRFVQDLSARLTGRRRYAPASLGGRAATREAGRERGGVPRGGPPPPEVSDIPFLRSEPGFSDADMREFVSAGVAAGIAAAFGAPVGGVLFSMEEAATFWSRRVAWRCFICAVAASFVISQLNARVDVGLLSFESVAYPGHRDWLFQLPFILLTSVVCGVLGAAFNVLRRTLWTVRASRTRPVLRLLEALAVSGVTCLVFFSVAYAFGSCQDVARDQKLYGVRLGCPAGTVNDLATLLLGSPEETIRSVFSLSSSVGTGPSSTSASSAPTTDRSWLPSLYRATSGSANAIKPCTPISCLYSPQAMAVCTLAYLLMMSLASGVAVPGGLFMPSILVGASGGALIGMLLQRVLDNDWTIEPGLYALIGACATLAGVFRSSISLVVILVEGTHGVDFFFSLIIAALVANYAASMVHQDGVYESELERDGTVFFLRHQVPRSLKKVQARDIMASPPICLRPVESLPNVLSVLRNTPHNGFPVVRPSASLRPDPELGTKAGGHDHGDGDGTHAGCGVLLEGFILRSQLLVLLQRRAFCDAQGRPKPLLLPLDELAGPPSSPPPSGPSSDREASPGVASVSLDQWAEGSAPPTFTSLPLGHDQLKEIDRVHRGFYSQGPGKPFRHRRHRLSAAEATDAILLDFLIEQEDPTGAGGPAPSRVYSPPPLSPRPSYRQFTIGSPSASLLDAHPGSFRGKSLPPPVLLSPVSEDASVRGDEGLGLGIIEREIEALRDLYMDLRPFMDRAPLTIHPEASGFRAYHIFLSLGLRHLCVVAPESGLLGIITRKDLKSAADRLQARR